MEETSALLSSLVQTRSIERVLAPIATQVSQLIIVNEAYENGDRSAFPDDLLSSSVVVRNSAESLVQVALRLTRDTADEELKHQMPPACEMLGVSGKEMVTATQRVHLENFSPESRRHLIRTAKDVLEGTLKVLLVSDKAEVRKILKSLSWTREKLGLLTAIQSMKQLVTTFKVFTEAVMLLTNLIEKRRLEMTHPQQREMIFVTMRTLKKCVPMLSSAMQTYVRYPGNQQAKASHDYVVGQIAQSLEELESIIENKPTVTCDFEEQEEPGHFITNIDKVLFFMSDNKRLTMAQAGSEFDCVVEAVIRHSMSVGHMALEKQKTLLVKNCQRVLYERKSVAELAANLKANPGFHQLRADFAEGCEGLVAEFQDLERHTNAAVLHLIVKTFCETVEPLDRFVKMAMQPATVDEALTGTCGMDAAEEAFHNHAEMMMQTARFVAASSPQPKRVRVISSCLRQLEGLDAELGAACRACQRCSTNPGATQHLRLLKQEWSSNVSALLSAVDDMTDPKQLLNASDPELRSAAGECKNSMYMEPGELRTAVHNVTGQITRFSHVASQVIDQNADPIYRNGMMVYVAQMQKLSSSIKSRWRRVSDCPGNLQNHQRLHRHCDTVLQCLSKIQDGLQGRGLLDLLDPARIQVRRKKHGNAGAEIDEDDSGDDEKENKFARNNVPVHRNPPESFQEQKHGLKRYVADVTSDQLRDLTRRLTSASVAGQTKQVDLEGNEVLSRCNHAVEVSRIITHNILSPQIKQCLLELNDEVIEQTPRLLDLSRRVAQSDAEQIEPLYQLAEKWAAQMSNMELTIDGILDHWKTQAYKVVDASAVSNFKLLSAQTKYLEEQCRQARDLGNTAASLCDASDPRESKKAFVLREHANQLENLTSTLSTMSDVASKSGREEDRPQLERCGREWAAQVYQLVTTVDSLACSSVTRVTGLGVCAEKTDASLAKKEVDDLTQHTMQLKNLAVEAVDGCLNDEDKTAGQTLLDDLDQLTGHMNDCCELLETPESAGSGAERLFAPHSLALLQWQWALKLVSTGDWVDQVTAIYSYTLDNILASGRMLKGSDRDEALVDYFRSIDFFKQQFSQSREKALDSIQTSTDVCQNSEARQLLEDLTDVSENTIAHAKKLPEDWTEAGHKELARLRRVWGAKALHLVARLTQLPHVNTTCIQDLKNHLSSQPKSSRISPVSQRKNNTTSPMVAAPITQNIPDYTDSFEVDYDFNTLVPTSKDILINAKPKPRMVKNLLQKSIDNRSNLTGSLLDFADDLLGTSGLASTSYVTTKQSAESTSNQVHILMRSSFEKREELGMSMWIAAEDEWDFDNIPGTSGILPQEKSWKELLQSPRVQHTTPLKSTPGSSYKPSSRPKTVALNYSPSLDIERWEDSNNAIVQVAKEVAQKVKHMTEYVLRTGPITTKEELITTVKDVAANGQTLLAFARILAEYSVDKRFAQELLSQADHVTTVIAQLSVMTSVKAATPDDRTAEKMLLKTSENLVQALNSMLTAAEATCVKGLHQPPTEALDETETIVLATQWHRRFHRERHLQAVVAERDELGLRKMTHSPKSASLPHIMVDKSA